LEKDFRVSAACQRICVIHATTDTPIGVDENGKLNRASRRQIEGELMAFSRAHATVTVNYPNDF
jgi:hypothetical protein